MTLVEKLDEKLECSGTNKPRTQFVGMKDCCTNKTHYILGVMIY